MEHFFYPPQNLDKQPRALKKNQHEQKRGGTIPTEMSDIQVRGSKDIKSVKKKGMKSPMTSVAQRGEVDDANSLALKYKQMRKNGEYTGGLSSDAQYNMPALLGQQDAAKQDGRFGPTMLQQHLNQLDGHALKIKAHRRVKSGASDKIHTNLKHPTVFNGAKQPNAYTIKADSNVPSSDQRSLKSIKNNNKKPPQNFMLIYEENLDG